MAWPNRVVMAFRPLQVLLGLTMLIVASLDQYNFNSRTRLDLLLFGITPTTLIIIVLGVHAIRAYQEGFDCHGYTRALRWAADLLLALLLSATIPFVFVLSAEDAPYRQLRRLEICIEVIIEGVNASLFVATFAMLVLDHCMAARRDRRTARPVAPRLSDGNPSKKWDTSHWSLESSLC